MNEERYCEGCAVSETEYGFDFDMNDQGEPMCQECLEDYEDMQDNSENEGGQN